MALYNTLKQDIKEKYKKHNLDRPLIVAIDGLGGAGKTTLVNHLKNVIDNVVIIHIDDHIVGREMRYNTGYDEWFEYYQLQWDTTYLKESLYEKLHQNEKQLRLPFYNREEDTSTSKTVNIPTNSIVVIEGIFLLREEWKAFYDYIIFIECPREVRYERVLHRDTYIGDLEERLRKYQNRYWLAEEFYLEKEMPLKFAHSILRV
ncbi:uridine kinase [Lysinibacillus contaminans]|uniref:Uridine kinase n=1 Tax=Lysinibacillus contaminans TaxID=1293441 RepID=A0ABR5K0P7_9BACI|nr:kinase [Lysinibacillus contaminans]KOS68434.1 uridine kinase [Lysinibacillus contaminans]